MGKLLDRLRKEYGVQPAARRHSVNFLTNLNEIAEARREGWTTKQIWAQMRKDNMTSMSYVHFCRLVKKHITISVDDVHKEIHSANISRKPSPSPEGSLTSTSAKSPNPSERKLTEKERLDLLKEEAFKSVRSPKPTGPLIGKPKSREEENRDLFGE